MNSGTHLPPFSDPTEKNSSSSNNASGKNKPKVNGIRGMEYSEDQGGNLISWSYSTAISVWNPNNSLNRPYVGKYEGHHGIVCCGKFCYNSPSCISVDDKNFVRVWDIKSLTTIQVFNIDQFSTDIGAMHLLPDDNLIICAKR